VSSPARLRPLLLAAVVLAIAVAGCMPGPNPLKGTPAADGASAGFWLGLWHGLIAPLTFVTSLFKDGTGFYEVHNNGGWYNAGYLFGLTLVLGGGFQSNVQLRRGGDASIPASTPPQGPTADGGEAEPRRGREAADEGEGGDLPPRGPRPGPAN
jgi:hypothetical protein